MVYSHLRAALPGIFLVILCGRSAQSQLKAQISPLDLVKAVIGNELKNGDDDVRWKYLLNKQVDNKQETREVVETKSGSLDRLLASAGRPLTQAAQREETDRILKLSHDPAEQQKLEESHRKEAEQYDAFLKVIPKAFLFEYAGEDGDLIKLNFRPNPVFQPSSRVEKVLQQMAGQIWVNAAQQRLAGIHGVLTDEVKFAGGLLGHLEKGGEFTIRRTEVAPTRWEVTELAVNMRGRAVLIKSICVNQTELHTNFQAVAGDLSLGDAAGLLLKNVTLAKR